MPKKALQQQLTELHEALGSATNLDPVLRQRLRDVADDIDALLGDEQDTAPDSADLQERVRRATVQFEAEHPRIAHIMSDVADTLSKLGF